jgi:lipid A 3-O-deacylase
MFRTVSVIAASLWLAAGAPTPARAQAVAPNMLAFSLGYYDINRQNDETGEARVEYRFGRTYQIFKPLAGVMATADGAVYVYGGAGVDIPLGHQFILTPSFAPGLYSNGGGKDLGHTIEFRSQIELAYILVSGARVAVSFNHISNAGLGDRNPGVESLALTYVVPAAWIFGR